jgi:hypothetical protein
MHFATSEASSFPLVEAEVSATTFAPLSHCRSPIGGHAYDRRGGFSLSIDVRRLRVHSAFKNWDPIWDPEALSTGTHRIFWWKNSNEINGRGDRI